MSGHVPYLGLRFYPVSEFYPAMRVPSRGRELRPSGGFGVFESIDWFIGVGLDMAKQDSSAPASSYQRWGIRLDLCFLEVTVVTVSLYFWCNSALGYRAQLLGTNVRTGIGRIVLEYNAIGHGNPRLVSSGTGEGSAPYTGM